MCDGKKHPKHVIVQHVVTGNNPTLFACFHLLWIKDGGDSEGGRKLLLGFRSGIVLLCGVNVKECNQRAGGGRMEDGLVDN